MVVRTCALDSGTLTVDTELVRMSHCGSFYFDDRYVRGCIVSCLGDACNAAHSLPGLWVLPGSTQPSLVKVLVLVTYAVLGILLHSSVLWDQWL